MQTLSLILCGLLIASDVTAATPDEAAQLFTARKWEQATAAYQSIVDKDPTNALAWFRLARAQAAAGDASKALASLRAWIATGGGSYQAAMTVPELQALRADPRFVTLVKPLKPCTAPEYRQFDFWLGDWHVESQASPGVVNRNRITSINGGCTLLEQYTTPSGYEGSSLNFYDSARKVWHQTWIDNQGAPLYLEGGFDGKSMVMATTADPKQINRITWTPLEDGRVRQHWEATTDGGATWSTVFDGYYSKRDAASQGNVPTAGKSYVSKGGVELKVLLNESVLGTADIDIAEIAFPAGTDSGDHPHGSTEIFYVLSGELEHVVNGQSSLLGPGMAAFVRSPDLVRHRTKAETRALVIWVPGGEAQRIVQKWQRR